MCAQRLPAPLFVHIFCHGCATLKALYAGLFSWIVDMANDHLGYKKGEPLPFIGVLDIFGFESFKVKAQTTIPPLIKNIQ